MDEVLPANSLILDWFLDNNTVMTGKIRPIFELIKGSFLIPLLRITLNICLFMSFLMSIHWLLMMVSVILAKIWRQPEKRYKWVRIEDNVEIGNAKFPLVLVQIPLFNEKEVYKLSIGAACNLSWPAERLLIQVLDDSTDVVVKDMIEKECTKWKGEGINIRYQHRQTRVGYKAGSLKEGMKHDYVKECEYVAIFDADFQPEPDFLQQTIPYLIHNKELAVVQARWSFVNADESFLTRMQEITLDYTFAVLEEGGSSLNDFFGFNGSGGIWRITAINEAGGWNDRTTIEDLDLSIRAALKGWKFVYLGNVHVKSELPSTFKAFRAQQHRWSCGPTNLFQKMAMEIAMSTEVSLLMKIYMTYDLLFAWRIMAVVFTFLFFCIVLPLATLIPEVGVRKSQSILIAFVVATINTAVTTPRSLHLAVPWVLFENLMSFHRTKALFVGLLQYQRANEWVVTQKRGEYLKNKSNAESAMSKEKRALLTNLRDRLLVQELGFAVFLLACASYGFFYQKDPYSIYLFLQAIFFAMAGFSLFGMAVHTS